MEKRPMAVSATNETTDDSKVLIWLRFRRSLMVRVIDSVMEWVEVLIEKYSSRNLLILLSGSWNEEVNSDILSCDNSLILLNISGVKRTKKAMAPPQIINRVISEANQRGIITFLMCVLHNSLLRGLPMRVMTAANNM